MPQFSKAIGCAVAIILAAVAARLGFIAKGSADATTMGIIVLWMATRFPRSCAGRATSGN